MLTGSLEDVARAFKITKKEAYSGALYYSNKRRFKILETPDKIGEEFADQIYEKKDYLLSDKYIAPITTYKSSAPVKIAPYVYFLYNDGVLVYIGQTKRLLMRLAAHQDTKVFNGVSVKEVDEKDFELCESLNIYYYQPVLNIQKKSYSEFYKLVLRMCDFW